MVRLWAALMDVGPPPAPTHARSTTRPIFPPLHPPLSPSSSVTVRLSTYLFSYLRLHVDPCLSFRGGKIRGVEFFSDCRESWTRYTRWNVTKTGRWCPVDREKSIRTGRAVVVNSTKGGN